MKTYTLAFADAIRHVPKNPERTAYKSGSTMDITYREWPSREAMLASIWMQGRRVARSTDWIDWFKCNMAAKLCSCEGPDSTGARLRCRMHKAEV